MIPGLTGLAVGLFFGLATAALWSAAVIAAGMALRDLLTVPPALRRCDAGTVALLLSGGFVCSALTLVAVA